MTEPADGVVYSRSGLTYQVGLLEKAGLLARSPSAEGRVLTVVRDHMRSIPPRSAKPRQKIAARPHWRRSLIAPRPHRGVNERRGIIRAGASGGFGRPGLQRRRSPRTASGHPPAAHPAR